MAHERATVELITGLRYRYGSFNKSGEIGFNKQSHLPYLTVENELQLVARLFSFFEPYLRLPVRIQTSDVRTAAHMADLVAGARMPILKEDAFWHFPAVTLFASLSFPTGECLRKSPGLFSEEITGRGSLVLGVGFLVEKQIQEIVYGIGYSFSAETDHFRDISPKPGATHEPVLTLGYSFDQYGNLALAILGTFQSRDRINQRPVKDSDRRKITASLGYSLALHSHVKITGLIGTDLPIPQIGKRFNNETFLRFGMRFGVF